MIATNIKWDTDGENIGLPTTVRIPDCVEVDSIADYLSDVTGFCVFSFVVIG